MSAAPGELVLCLPRDVIFGAGSWRGVVFGDVAPLVGLIETHGEYRARDQVETDPSWKQVIPYVVLRDRGRIYLMRRTRAGSDARLHERWSIGIGGHVNPGDGGVAGGLAREWAEELVTDWEPSLRLVGLLNDDTDPVGQVHLGIVYAADARGPVAVRETAKLEGQFVPPLDVLRVYDRLETWSSLLYDYLTGRSGGTRVEALVRRQGPGHPLDSGRRTIIDSDTYR